MIVKTVPTNTLKPIGIRNGHKDHKGLQLLSSRVRGVVRGVSLGGKHGRLVSVSQTDRGMRSKVVVHMGRVKTYYLHRRIKTFVGNVMIERRERKMRTGRMARRHRKYSKGRDWFKRRDCGKKPVGQTIHATVSRRAAVYMW